MAVNQTLSAELFERACAALPGGVSSPVRAFRAVGGKPVFIANAKGAHFEDVDGNRFLDFVCSWGPLILGHAHDEILDAVHTAAARGLTYGAPHRGEVELAELVKSCYPGVEQTRFTSSGTEATMSAIRLARGVTGRPRLIKFSGCYHGHSDGLLVAAGSGAVTFGQASSAGVPAEIASLTTVLPLDDIDAFAAFMEAEGHTVGGVIVEPIPANNGLLLQRPEYLQAMRDITKKHGSLLIFDEVISGFRVAAGGAAEIYGIEPDIVTFGKILGGGMPVGAFGGPAATFEHLAPNGPVYHAGTLSGNPVAMAAGQATLKIQIRDKVFDHLEQLGSRLEAGMRTRMAQHGWPVGMVRQGSIFWFYFTDGEAPRTAEAIHSDCAQTYAKFFRGCFERGVYLAPSAYEVGFLSQAHTVEDIDHAIEVFSASLHDTFS